MAGYMINSKNVITEYVKHDTESLVKTVDDFYVSSKVLSNITRVQSFVPLCGLLDKKQMAIKKWVLDISEQLDILDNKSICVCGGKYGLLSALIFSQSNPRFIHSVDQDDSCKDIANVINTDEYFKNKFLAETVNAQFMVYKRYDTIINTSFDHISSINTWKHAASIRPNKPILVQSNNQKDAPDHKNCYDNHDELLEAVEFDVVYYKGTLKINELEQYMIIGSYTERK